VHSTPSNRRAHSSHRLTPEPLSFDEESPIPKWGNVMSTEHSQVWLPRGPVMALTATAVGSVVLTRFITWREVRAYGFKAVIKAHFNGIEYSAFRLTSRFRVVRKSTVRYQQGSGSGLGRSGEELEYRWVFLTSVTGDPLAGYLGTSEMTSTQSLPLTRGQTGDRLRRCSAIGDTPRRFACFDAVVAQMVSDCQNSTSIEDCHEQCFYDRSQCVGG
jgi:hypothetical protein